MSRRALLLFPVMMTAFVAALSTGRSIFYLIGFSFLLCYMTGFVTFVLLKGTLRLLVRMPQKEVLRGQTVSLSVFVKHSCFLPVSPFFVTVSFGGQEVSGSMEISPFKEEELRLTIPALHVGSYDFKVEEGRIGDAFGLFTVKKHSHRRKNSKNSKNNDRFAQTCPILVLPRPFDIEKPTVAAGDTGLSALGRTQEDYAAPEDVRSYIPGDAMKRIHWKLSAEKRELLVRRYETPAPPDTLILVDGSQPDGDTQECILSYRDALCETAVAVAAMQLSDMSPVRVPFYGEFANEFQAEGKENLTNLQEMLAMQPFSSSEPFERALQLETRRMRRTGAVILLTTRLTPEVVESTANIRRLGPHVRLYLVSRKEDGEENEELLPMINRLQHHLVEVLYVTPA